MCNSKTDTVRLHLCFIRENDTFIIGEDSDGNRRSFRKQDVSFVVNRKQDSVQVIVDRKRLDRIKARRSEKAPTAEMAKTKKERKCLNCKHPFMADAVTFICTPCKRTQNWKSGGDYSLVA